MYCSSRAGIALLGLVTTISAQMTARKFVYGPDSLPYPESLLGTLAVPFNRLDKNDAVRQLGVLTTCF